MNLVAHFDGGARGNPGPAGAGVVIRTETGELIHEGAYFLGQQTNNAAEYMGLLAALRRLEKCSVAGLELRSDSELLVKQLTGGYRVRNPGLAALFEQAQLLLLRVGRWRIQHVRREQNRRADELANIAMDERRTVIIYDREGAGAGGAAKSEPSNLAPAGDSIVRADPGHARRVRVVVQVAPKPGGCPAGAAVPADCELGTCTPAGICVHAAHAMMPTIVAVLTTAGGEFDAVPTLTVRCGRPECGAVLQVSPKTTSNGHAAG